ncbi:hypothetical protein HPB47_006239, partial [Ixodes persulcatus]
DAATAKKLLRIEEGSRGAAYKNWDRAEGKVEERQPESADRSQKFIENLIVVHINERLGHLLADMNKHRGLTLAKLELCSQTRGSPQTSTKSFCRCPTAISDRGGGHNLSTVTTSALQEDAGPGTLEPKHLSRRYYAHDTPLTQDFHAVGRIATNR